MPNLEHRIALVTGGVALGGSTTFLVNLGGELIRRGIAVEVLSFDLENPLAGDFQKQGIVLLRQDQHRTIFEDRLQTILRQLARFRPTVIIATLGAVSFEVLRYVPENLFRVGFGQSDDPLVYDMMRHYAPWTDLVAVVSTVMKQKIKIRPEFANVPVASLPYGVPMCPARDLPVRETGHPLRILYVGRLGREQKRVHLFPEILRHLTASDIPFHWTIAGDGAERGFLEANLKSAGPLQTVSFTGAVQYAEVPALLAKHDIFILASDYEGLPLSLLEAMGCGLVPIVSDLKSGIPEVVDSSNGILVPVDDVQGYAQAIVWLHEHRDEFTRKSAAARARVEKDFSVTAMTDRWLNVIPPKISPTGVWPDKWRVTAPLTARHPAYFSPLMRALRRAAVRLRSGG